MTLTQLIRKLESQLKTAESYARSYDNQANTLRKKLERVSRIVGKRIEGAALSGARFGARLARKSRRMSAKGRARIIAAQKKRWASYRSKDKKSTGRRKMSAAGRARIIAAQKKRWAAHRSKQAAKA